MTIKMVMRRQSTIIRLFRLVWTKGVVGDGTGYSVKLSLAVQPKLYQFIREHNGWILFICGIRLHKLISYGGIFI